jgi:hypothetical protein
VCLHCVLSSYIHLMVLGACGCNFHTIVLSSDSCHGHNWKKDNWDNWEPKWVSYLWVWVQFCWIALTRTIHISSLSLISTRTHEVQLHSWEGQLLEEAYWGHSFHSLKTQKVVELSVVWGSATGLHGQWHPPLLLPLRTSKLGHDPLN